MTSAKPWLHFLSLPHGWPVLPGRVTAICLLTLVCSLTATRQTASAAVIYVDNIAGNDARSGSSPEVSSRTAGPVRTIRHALRLATESSTIILANTGRPYYESVTLAGSRHSGSVNAPFVIIGNGAVLDGSAPVPPGAWRADGGGIWSFPPWRKGHYQLLRDGKPAPEVNVPPNARQLPALDEGFWAAWRGRIWFRPQEGFTPTEYNLSFARLQTGLTLFAVRNVRISNLELRHFRLDGANAHDLCDGVTLDNVRASGNGRSGITAAGTSVIAISRCTVSDNRQHSVLVSERSIVRIVESELSQPPDVLDPPGQSPQAADNTAAEEAAGNPQP